MEASELRSSCSHSGGVIGGTEGVVVAKQVSVAANPSLDNAEEGGDHQFRLEKGSNRLESQGVRT